MNWRDSLPARVAMATTGLLALVLLTVTGAAYTITALMIRDGMDTALRASLPMQTGGLNEVLEGARKFEEEDHEHRHIGVLEPSGTVRFGPVDLPLEQRALDRALRTGEAFYSATRENDVWQVRSGPDWWQALTPRSDEVRVLYVTVGEPDRPVVIQLSAPLDHVSETLPHLLRWLLLLGGLGALLCGLIAWRMAGRTYVPLRAITATADDISTRTPSLRIPDMWHDRTLRRLIAVLNAMIARLQQAVAMQGRFTAAAAHELRGPLGAMRAELEVTLRRERPAAEYRRALEGALEETGRLTGLAEHLLMLARYERGALLAMERDLPLAPLLERAAAEASRSAGGPVHVEAPPDLLLDGDPLALERLVSNLARNGIQAGGAPVTIAAEPSGEEVAIHVRDTGCGMPREALPHLFEPFFRLDPARDRRGGTGLGLAIVKTVVDAHGGRIEVESTPGLGSAFHVWLPRRQAGSGT
jgi:signal transduction histidine kinase